MSINLTGQDTIKYGIYSSRTGSNLNLSIHDSGGTTTTHTALILSVNNWQTETWDISGVSDANKDAIDSIIITVLNADAENTFYLDNMYGVGVTKTTLNGEFSFAGIGNKKTWVDFAAGLTFTGTIESLLAVSLVTSGDTTFSVGDILRVKDGVDDEWMRVVTASGSSVYTVTRDLAGDYAVNDNPTWKKGTTIVNYGASGEGVIFQTASEANAPHIDVLTHAGSPWTSTNTRVRIGNLNGYLGYSTDEYGIAIGETDKYLKYDPTNGLQVKGNILATTGTLGNLSIETDGSVRSGQTAYNVGTGFWLGDDSGTTKLSIGNEIAGEVDDPASWDLLDEDCSDISDWVSLDQAPGVSEVDPAGQFRFDTNASAAGNDSAGRRRDIGEYPNTFTVEIKVYHDAISGVNDHFLLRCYQPTKALYVYFWDPAIKIVNPTGGSTEVGTNLVKSGGSAEWQTWRFLVNFSTDTCDVYLNDSTHDWEKVGIDISCGYEGTWTDGRTELHQMGWNTDNRITHTDYIKIATGLYGGSSPTFAWDGSVFKVGSMESLDYVSTTTGYKLTKASGLEINTGTIKPSALDGGVTTTFTGGSANILTITDGIITGIA